MVHFEGVEAFALPPSHVFAKLADAGFLANSLPEATVMLATPDKSSWKVKPKMAFIAGELATDAVVVERIPEETIRYKLDTKGIGSGSTVEAVLKFAADGTGTLVTWTGDIVAMTGLLKLAPKGLIQGSAQQVIKDCWNAIRAKME